MIELLTAFRVNISARRLRGALAFDPTEWRCFETEQGVPLKGCTADRAPSDPILAKLA